MSVKTIPVWVLWFSLACLGCSPDSTVPSAAKVEDQTFASSIQGVIPSDNFETQNNVHFGFAGGNVSASGMMDRTETSHFRFPGKPETRDGAGPFGGGQTQQTRSGESDKPDSPQAQRKLIQNFNLEVAVKNLDEAEQALGKIIESANGFVSQSDRGSQMGQRRQGRWTIRVPGKMASDLAKTIMALGEPIRQTSKTQDVTEEFFDIEARLKNKRIEEERLVKHLKDSTGKLEDILLVEKEITRVRGEIEQAQGRLNLLANMTSLATLQVLLAEYIDYKPEAAPTFSTRVERTFFQSLGGLTLFGENITLLLVSILPWFPVLLIVVVPLTMVARKGLKALTQPAPVPRPKS